MPDQPIDHKKFYEDDPNWTNISSRQVQPNGVAVRHASEVMEGNPEAIIVEAREDLFLRIPTGKTRTLVKATFLEDNRSIKTLSLTKFSNASNHDDKSVIHLKSGEVDELIAFVNRVKSAELTSAGQMHIEVGRPEARISDDEARRLYSSNPGLFAKLVEQENLAEDIVAVGYRRHQLTRFQELLESPTAFQDEVVRLGCRAEDVWQRFFEANKWIFGYGLSYQFLSGLDGKTMEQVVRGFSLAGKGKRADGVLKTRGALSSLCFVEIKRHDTSLLKPETYRADSWQPSDQLVGGVAQV